MGAKTFSAAVAVGTALLTCPAPGVTKHYSFTGGYPATTTRQPTSATGAAFGAASSGAAKKPVEKSLVGKVVRIDSGDQIGVTPTGGRRIRVRLDRVDAPEQGQPSGVEAKKFLFDLVNGREVTVRYFERDRSGTVYGTVYVPREEGLVEVNLTLVKNGWAWVSKPAQTPGGSSEAARERAYAAAEADAKNEKRGLWAAPNPVRPSEWRKLRH